MSEIDQQPQVEKVLNFKPYLILIICLLVAILVRDIVTGIKVKEEVDGRVAIMAAYDESQYEILTEMMDRYQDRAMVQVLTELQSNS